MARRSTIIGAAKLQKKLDRLPKIAKQYIRDEMAKAADEVVAMMKSLVPVSADGSHGNAPGTLRDSIGWRWGKTAPKGARIVAAITSKVGGDLTLTIYAGSSKAFYARWVEFGTEKMPAHQYFFISWKSNRKGAKKRVRKAVRDSAKRVAKGG